MKKQSLIVLVPLALVLLALPATAGDLIKLQGGKWQPATAAPSGATPSAEDYEKSNIEVTDENYDYVYFRFTNVNISQKQHVDTSSVEKVFYQDTPPAYIDASNAMANGNYADAIQRFERIATNSSLKDWVRMYALWDMATVYGRGVGDLPNAVATWERLQKQFPKSRFVPDAIISSGKALINLGKADEAKSKFLELQRLPGLAESQKMLAKYYVIYIKQKQGEASGNKMLLNQALNEYKELLSQVENDSNLKQVATLARLGVGDCLLALEQYGEAQDYFQKIADSGTEKAVLAGAYNGLGRCYLAKRQWKDALIAFLRTVVLYDEVPEQTAMALVLAGDSYAYLRSGDDWRDRAKGLYRECMQKFPGTEYARKAENGYNSLR